MRKLTSHDLDAAQRRREAPCINTDSAWCVDIELLLRKGTMEGPYMKPVPVVCGWLDRVLLAIVFNLRALLQLARSHKPKGTA